MAVVEITNGRDHGRSVQTYEDRPQRRKEQAQSKKLSDFEIGELQYAWNELAGQLGCRSIQGAIEAKLMRSPPSNRARGYVLEELERAGGRAPEGAIVRILTADYKKPKYEDVGKAAVSRHEFVRAIRYLVLHGKVERLPVVMPKNDETKEMTTGQREWTGYDLRIVRRERGELTMRLALVSPVRPARSAQDSRWRAQDEALERELHTIQAKDRGGGAKQYEDDKVPNTAKAAAVFAAIEKMSARSAIVLRAAYGHAGARIELPDMRAVLPMTNAVRSEMQRLAEDNAAKRESVSFTKEQLIASAYRELRPLDILRDRTRDLAFMGRVSNEANDMLVRACTEYRRARGPREQDA